MARKITPAQVQAVGRYEAANYDKILVRIRKDGGDGFTADDLRAAAAAGGESLNAWALKALKGRLAGGELPAPAGPTMPAAPEIAPPTLAKATQAAQATGETVPAFLARAVDAQAQRDDITRRLTEQREELDRQLNR